MSQNRGLLVAAVLVMVSPLLVFVAVGGVLHLMISPIVADRWWSVPVDATVVSRSWRRTIEIQRWDEVERGDWCVYVPVGAEILHRENRRTAAGRIPSMRPFPSHSTPSSGPARPWCTFRIVEWIPEQAQVATGTTEPRIWPEAPAEDACAEPWLGCVRGSTRIETLVLGVALEGAEPAECPVSQEAWSGHAVGDRLKVPTSVVFGRILCSRIE